MAHFDDVTIDLGFEYDDHYEIEGELRLLDGCTDDVDWCDSYREWNVDNGYMDLNCHPVAGFSKTDFSDFRERCLATCGACSSDTNVFFGFEVDLDKVSPPPPPRRPNSSIF